MRKRKTREPETIFPVTDEDWRNARHEEDPADIRHPGQIDLAIEAQGSTTEEPYNRLNLYKR